MKLRKKAITEDEEAIVSLFRSSPEWLVVKKLINNEIVNLYQMYPKATAESADDASLASTCKGVTFTISELRRFIKTIERIGNRVERRKDASGKKREKKLS